MRKIVFLLLFIYSGTKAFSQQEFFVYLQSDNHEPFYARINAKIYSSSETGYMIIPKLGDSTYEIVIGFAKNAYPEQIFPVSINKKDKGFQLKNLGEKGWALSDLQNMSVIMNASVSSKPVEELSGARKTDAFSELLANVVNDTAILYSVVKTKPREPIPEKTALVTSKPVEKTAQEKEVTIPLIPDAQQANKELAKHEDSVSTLLTTVLPPAKNGIADPLKDTLAKTNTSIVPPVKIADGVIIKDPVKKNMTTVEKPFITRIEEKKTQNMYQATYLEQYILTTDTVKITIPLNDSAVSNQPSAEPEAEKPNESDNEKNVVEVPKVPAKPVAIDSTNQKNITEEKIVTVTPVVIDSTIYKKRAIQVNNSDCKNFATDYDVDKLRVKLINDKSIDDKLATAKKYFKTKCFSVKQIKALTELFPSDETKYRFFNTSYPFVSDTSNFYRLEEVIENDYYKTRFKAMILK